MASVNFYIEKRRDPDGRLRTENAPILLYFSFEGKRLQMTTGEKVNLEYWNDESQKVDEGFPGSRQINTYLESLQEEVYELYREAKLLGITPGVEYIRTNIRNRKKRSGYSFFDVLMNFIERNYDRWSISTFMKIKTMYNHLRNFAEREEYIVTFDWIDKDFFKRIVEYFRTTLGHSNSTIHKNLLVLKWFLNWATRNGYNKNIWYRDYQFSWKHEPKSEPADLFLSWNEVMRLYQLETADEMIEKARDLFCFMCFTGMKHSQLIHLKKSDIMIDKIRLSIPGQILQEIPLNRYSRLILQKYEYHFFPSRLCLPTLPNPKINRLLKEAGKQAGINQPVDLKVYKGNDIQQMKVPKYQTLSTKLARNTFIMNALRLRIPPEIIMRYTGYKVLTGINKIDGLLKELEKREMKKFDRIK